MLPDTISVDPEYLISLGVSDLDHVGHQLHVLLDHHPRHHGLRAVVILGLQQCQADGLVRDEVQGSGVGRGANLVGVEVVHDVGGALDRAPICYSADIAKSLKSDNIKNLTTRLLSPVRFILSDTTIQTVRRRLQVMMINRNKRIENKLSFFETFVRSIFV